MGFNSQSGYVQSKSLARFLSVTLGKVLRELSFEIVLIDIANVLTLRELNIKTLY